MKINKVKCFKPFSSKRCSSKLRKISENDIRNLKLVDGRMHLDTSLLICDSCRLHSSKKGIAVAVEQSIADDNEQDVHSTAIPIAEHYPSTSQHDLEQIPSAASIASTSSQDSVIQKCTRAHNIELFNKGVAGISVSPISTNKIQKANYPRKKYLNIAQGLRKNIFGLEVDEDMELIKSKAADFDEMISQLKEKFAEPACSRNDQLRILTVLPKSWSNQKIVDEFGTNKYIVSQV